MQSNEDSGAWLVGMGIAPPVWKMGRPHQERVGVPGRKVHVSSQDQAWQTVLSWEQAVWCKGRGTGTGVGGMG